MPWSDGLNKHQSSVPSFATCFVGVMAGVVACCIGFLPRLFGSEVLSLGYATGFAVASISLLLLAYVLARPAMAATRAVDNDWDEPERSRRMFGKYLAGVGFALLLDAIVCASVLATLVLYFPGRSDTEADLPRALLGDEFDANSADQVLASPEAHAYLGGILGETREEAVFVVVMLAASTLVAVLGALFFFANSIWRRLADPDRDQFDSDLFWAGLWFRLGEAIIFNLVLFFLLRYYAPERFFILPLVALLVGMFLKSGEKLIAGIADRVFAAFDALIPQRIPTAPPLPKTLTLTVSALFEQGDEQVAALVKNLEAVSGVMRVVTDAGNAVLRVEYDARTRTRELVIHELEFAGFATDD